MRIIKRRKGRKEYLYLQYSFRKGKKVFTREKYLGLEMPDNIEKIRDELKQEIENELHDMLNKIKEHFQAEWKKLPESVKENEKEEIAIAFTYNTNAIECSTITLEETREIIQDKIAPNKSLRDIKETEAHNRVFLQMLNKKEKITNLLFLRWHKEIFGETKSDIAGRYRDYLVRVGPYLAPDWQEVQSLMNKLINFINKNSRKIHPVELTARIHYRFEKIHPFGDGNGRIGRLLMNNVLWHAGYPMIIIEYKKRKSYYKALQKDEDDFVRYFIRRFLAIHRKRYLS